MQEHILQKLLAVIGSLVVLISAFVGRPIPNAPAPLLIPTAPHARYYNPKLGAAQFNPVQAQAFKLAGSGVTATATSTQLSKFTLPDASTTITMANFGDIGFGTLEPGASREESISFTTVTQNSDGTATLGGVTRGLNFVFPYTAVTAYQKAHAGGTPFILSNTSAFYNQFAIANNTTTIKGNWTFSSTTLPVVSSDTTDAQISNATWTLATVNYVNGVATSGAANATVAVKGIIQLSTALQTASGTVTGSTAASLVVPTSLFSATSSVSGNVPVIGSNGFLSTNFINTSTPYAWTTSTFSGGEFRVTASTTLSGTTTFASGTILTAGSTSTFNGGISIASTSLATITFKSSGDDTTNNTSYQGIANISSTAMTIGAHRVLLTFLGDVRNGAASSNNFDFQMDGTRVSGAAGGLTQLDIITAEANQRYPLSMSFLTSVATSGVHTFGVQWKTSANTLTLDGVSPVYTFSAIELPISQ